MDNEEKYLEQQFGRKNPFCVPEDYFVHLSENIMKAIPDAEDGKTVVKGKLWHRYRPMAIAAAIVLAIAVSSLTYFERNVATPSGKVRQSAKIIPSDNDSAIDQAIDYTMLDDDDMYAYVTSY